MIVEAFVFLFVASLLCARNLSLPLLSPHLYLTQAIAVIEEE